MNRIVIVLMGILCMVGSSVLYAAKTSGNALPASPVEIRRNIVYTQLDLGRLIDYLNKEFKANIVLAPGLEGIRVDIQITSSDTLEKVLKRVCIEHQFDYKKSQNRIFIYTAPTSDQVRIMSLQLPEQKSDKLARAKCELSSAPMEACDSVAMSAPADQGGFNTEEYGRVFANGFKQALVDPLSTFSIDVDTAAYANARRFLNSGTLPPKDAVRLEEFINYFHYNNPAPKDDRPFALSTELSDCSWTPAHQLIKISLQGRDIEQEHLPPSNLVFLIDVSGSMSDPNKLPLLKSAFHLLVNNLRAEDNVSIVVYAGAAGVVLDSVSGREKARINEAIDHLEAGGSTAGGQGIMLAYQIAGKNFLPRGNNRVILATDGDFNIGISSTAELTRMIESKRNEGIYLSVLGFGMGNYKDNRMESLADQGNGNYAYIDNMLEAKKVFVNQLAGTLFTIAKDVKLQVEFNPAKVKSYRLIGYENRLLNREDFDNDKKDAGEMGVGHTVTALYELELNDNTSNSASGLRYQDQQVKPQSYQSDEVLTIKIRYKEPGDEKSRLFTFPVPQSTYRPFEASSDDFRFASAVAEWGMLLSDNVYKGNASFEHVLLTARKSLGADDQGYRREMLNLVRVSQDLSH